MTKTTVLLVDNDPYFSATRKEFLEQEGYTVLLADRPEVAKQILKMVNVNLAIIDIRLEDDDDDKDTSGLKLAREIGMVVPKLILTGFPNYEYVREALRAQDGGAPIAADFVTKQEGPNTMLKAVRRTLLKKAEAMGESPPNSQEGLRRVTLDLSAQLEQDYAEIRKQAIFIHRIRLVLIVVGIMVILAGALAALWGYVSVGIVSAISGVITEALGFLFTRYAAETNKRMDLYHKELLGLYKKKERAAKSN